MTSTLISDFETKLKDGACALLRRGTVVAGIDAGSDSTKVAIVGAHHGKPVIHRLLGEQGEMSDVAASLVNNSCSKRVCGLSGHEVRTYLMEFPAMPAGDLDILLRRNVSRSLHKEPVVCFETREMANSRVEVTAVASPAGHVRESFQKLADKGVAFDAAYADVMALAECAKFAYPAIDQKPVCVLDMGATWSHLVLLVGGNLVFSRSMMIGINTIVHRASDLCGISRDEAREIVFSAGIAGAIDSHDEADLLIRTYAESVREVIEHLIAEIRRSLSFTSIRHNLPVPEVILLCGGACKLPGMQQVLSAETGVSVEMLDPLRAMPKGDDFEPVDDGSLFCVAIGLALLGLRPRSPGFRPAPRAADRGPEARLITALAACLTLLFLTIIGARVLDSAESRYAQAAERETHVLNSLLEVLAADGATEAGQLPSRGGVYSALSGTSPRWADVLKVISHAVPEGVVFEEMVFSRGESAPGDFPPWTLTAAGAVTDMNRTSELLSEMQEALESSELFTEVGIMPQGFESNTGGGQGAPAAIRFVLEAGLE